MKPVGVELEACFGFEIQKFKEHSLPQASALVKRSSALMNRILGRVTQYRIHQLLE